MKSYLSKEAPSIISIRTETDILAARMAARMAARKLGFHNIDQARIAAATSELTRNILTYAAEGTVTIQEIYAEHRHGIEIVFEDQGPGIANVNQIFQDNAPHHHNGEARLGLTGSRRLMDNMEIVTTSGVGTRIICQKWLR